MRHAKSSWDDLSINDFDRPLTKRGKKNAKMICEFFVKKKFEFDYALISSSKRTKKTFTSGCKQNTLIQFGFQSSTTQV